MCVDVMVDVKRMITGNLSGRADGMERSRGDSKEHLRIGKTLGVDDSREDGTNEHVLRGQRRGRVAVKALGVSSYLLTPDQAKKADVKGKMLQTSPRMFMVLGEERTGVRRH